jgi:hypothetical protein
MGGIVTVNLRGFYNSDKLQLTIADVTRCRLSSQRFCYPNTITSEERENDWSDMEIEAEFMTQLISAFLADLSGSGVAHINSQEFVQAVLQIIALSFTQFKYPDQYQERFNSLVLSTFALTHASFKHFILFKYSLDQVMSKLLSHEYDRETRKSWSKLMNSILKGILPLCPESHMPYPGSQECEGRLYTSLENVVKL